MDTASSDHSWGQLSNTCWAISAAESFGLKANSLVLPLTKISRRFTLSDGIRLLIAAGVEHKAGIRDAAETFPQDGA